MIELIESIVIVDSLKLGAGTSRLGLYDSHGNITLMPILIGFCLQWGLFGALSVQVCKSTTCALSASISNHYNILFRSLLLGVVEWSSLYKNLGLCGVCCRFGLNDLIFEKGYQEFAAGFGNILALEEVGLLWFAAPVLTAIGVYNTFLGILPLVHKVKKVSFVVQVFYAYRIKLFTQLYIIPSLVTLVKIHFHASWMA